MPGSLEKAKILRLDQGGGIADTLQVMFNPKEYTLSKQNSWKSGNNTNTNVPQVEFGGGQPTTLKMQLFFDTYENDSDVRAQTDQVYRLMFVDQSFIDKKSKKGRPPGVRFQWGRVGFDGVITNISQRFTLFKTDGTPVRAVLDVSFQETKDPDLLPKQNPTSGTAGGERIWIVKKGDTLAMIAFNQYHDQSSWRLIADHNALTSVRQLTPGTQLVIPNA